MTIAISPLDCFGYRLCPQSPLILYDYEDSSDQLHALPTVAERRMTGASRKVKPNYPIAGSHSVRSEARAKQSLLRDLLSSKVTVGAIVASGRNTFTVCLDEKLLGLVGYQGDDPSTYFARAREIKVFDLRFRSPDMWTFLQEAYEKREPVIGRIVRKKGDAYAVEVLGLTAMLPYSEIDISLTKSVETLSKKTQPFLILSLSKRLETIVVSRKAVLLDSGIGIRQLAIGETFRARIATATDESVALRIKTRPPVDILTDRRRANLPIPAKLGHETPARKATKKNDGVDCLQLLLKSETASYGISPWAPHKLLVEYAARLSVSLQGNVISADGLADAATKVYRQHKLANQPGLGICVMLLVEIIVGGKSDLCALSRLQAEISQAFSDVDDEESAEMYKISAFELGIKCGRPWIAQQILKI